ncbi:MAG: methyltransferase [Candidatus Woesearchaeota archaeon]
MIIEFTSDLKKQDIYANGIELIQILGIDCDSSGNRITTRSDDEKKLVVSFDNPVLVTDNYKIGLLDPVLRDTTFALFSSHKKMIVYDSVSMNFEQRRFPTVWGPSIDTILLCKALKTLKNNSGLDDVKKAIEIGSGSGFVSKYLLEKNSQIKQVTLIDINKEAKDCAELHIKDPRMKFVVGSGMDYILNKKYDLIICNPPYIPRSTTVEDNPYEGIGLLSSLITKGYESLNKNGMLLLNISSLCEKQEIALIKEMGLKYEKIDTLTVPLKVFRVLNNDSWMNYLHNAMKKETHDGYHYWQTISIYKITKE